MFRKSPYLDRLPGAQPAPGAGASQLPAAPLGHQEHHFCTAEVAALCLDARGRDAYAAESLVAWFDVFSERYLCIREPAAARRLDSEAQLRLEALAAPG